MTDRADAVGEALRRAKTNRTGMMDLTVDAPRNWLTLRLIEAFDDRAILAGEVERLRAENQRLQDAWLSDETIQPDGSLRPSVAALVEERDQLRQQIADEQDRVQRLCRALRGVFSDKMRLERAIGLALADTPADDGAEGA